MSLINQMLKDLDARHEADARGRLHREVRALPEAKENSGLRLAVVVLLVLTVGAAALWLYARYAVGIASVAVQPVDAPAVSSTSPVVPVTPPVSSVEVATPVSAEQSVPAAAEAAPLERVAQDPESGLKIASMLDKLPTSEPPSAKGVASTPGVPQKRIGGGDGAAPAKPVIAPHAPAPAPKNVGPGGVDKSPVAKTLREKSETDYRRAVTLVTGARFAEATDVLLDVLRQDGGHVSSRQLLARLLIEQRRVEEAMAILAEGLVGQPGQVQWAMMLARLQVDRGDLAGAARTLQQSQSFAAGNADYQGFAGHVQHRLGQEKASVDFYQSAARLAPADGRWWLGLGLALEADHRPAEAREAFLRARASGSLNSDLAAVVDQKLR